MRIEDIGKSMIARAKAAGISKEKRQSMARIGIVKLLSFSSNDNLKLSLLVMPSAIPLLRIVSDFFDLSEKNSG